jgi:hypothetical protein
MPCKTKTNCTSTIAADLDGPLQVCCDAPGRYYRIEYWSDDFPKEPLGTQFMWHHTANDAKNASLAHMGAVCFPGGLGVHYDYINVVPASYVPDATAYVTDDA